MPPVIRSDFLEHVSVLVVRQRLLEEEPGGESVAVDAPGFENGDTLLDKRCCAARLSLFHEHFSQVDREKDELVIELTGSEFLPELPEDALRLRQLAQGGNDPSFEPMQAELGIGVRKLRVKGSGLL